VSRLNELASDLARQATVREIARVQRPSGLIPSVEGEQADPWNHVEAAMALSSQGAFKEAELAYRWLARTQRANGSWFASYGEDGEVADHRVDTNATAYVATGLWHHAASTGDLTLADELYPMLERSLSYVSARALASGAIAWNVDRDGHVSRSALRAASSSIYLSFRAAISLGLELGRDTEPFVSTATRLRVALLRCGDEFLVKDEFAMDWYYPVIAGVTSTTTSQSVFDARAHEFVTRNGVLCRSDRRWVTTAETAECAIALCCLGRREQAEELLMTCADKRQESGAYLTGIVYPERSPFPPGETTSYSAAAVLLATDVLSAHGASEALFCEDEPSLATRTLRLPQLADVSSVKAREESASR
jgi:hypothetical protein